MEKTGVKNQNQVLRGCSQAGLKPNHMRFFLPFKSTCSVLKLCVLSRLISDVMCKDLSWYDVTATGDFASRMTEDLNKMQDGMGEKVKSECKGSKISFRKGGHALPFYSDWYWRVCLPLHTGGGYAILQCINVVVLKLTNFKNIGIENIENLIEIVPTLSRLLKLSLSHAPALRTGFSPWFF